MISKEEYDKARKIVVEFRKQEDNHKFRLAKLMANKLSKYIISGKYIVIKHWDCYDNEYSFEIRLKRKHREHPIYNKKLNNIQVLIAKKYGYEKGFYNFWIK